MERLCRTLYHFDSADHACTVGTTNKDLPPVERVAFTVVQGYRVVHELTFPDSFEEKGPVKVTGQLWWKQAPSSFLTDLSESTEPFAIEIRAYDPLAEVDYTTSLSGCWIAEAAGLHCKFIAGAWKKWSSFQFTKVEEPMEDLYSILENLSGVVRKHT